jgi:hypothetical protein
MTIFRLGSGNIDTKKSNSAKAPLHDPRDGKASPKS